MADAVAQLVFSGGGTRCFWQGGVMEVCREPLALAPERVTGVSGGALSAACFIAGRGRRLADAMTSAFAETDSNLNLHEPVAETGLTPHQQIYRDVVGETLDADASAAVAGGPAFQVLLARPPSGRLARFSGSAAALAYEAELHLGGGPHFRWARRLGLLPVLVDARAAAAGGRLVDLVCAAAAIPPVFAPPTWDGGPVIDGGMADQAPLPSPDRGRTLILLTRDYGAVPEHPDRIYLAPSREVPADKIDFTDPGKVRRTWEMGEADGRAFARAMRTDNS